MAFATCLSIFVISCLIMPTHWLHCRFLPCKQRTNTQSQTVFALSRPHPVVFDFSGSGVLIKLEPDTLWTNKLQWQYTPQDCMVIKVLSGRAHIFYYPVYLTSGSLMCGSGCSFEQTPETRVSFGQGTAGVSTVFELNFRHDVYRTICSAIQDAEVYMDLCSTPIWIRLIYHVLKRSPIYDDRASNWWIDFMLGFQLRAIRYVNNIHTYEGSINPYLFWLSFDRPPDWMDVLYVKSIYAISKASLSTSFWIGKLWLGMSTEYAEYTPVEASLGSKD